MAFPDTDLRGSVERTKAVCAPYPNPCNHLQGHRVVVGGGQTEYKRKRETEASPVAVPTLRQAIMAPMFRPLGPLHRPTGLPCPFRGPKASGCGLPRPRFPGRLPGAALERQASAQQQPERRRAGPIWGEPSAFLARKQGTRN